MATGRQEVPPRGWDRFAPELTLGEARSRLFALGGLGEDGGYGHAWVKLRLWRVPIWFPNTRGRRRAVRFHDLHHVLTGYPTDWRGEFEIAAWEIATGIGRRNRAAGLPNLIRFPGGPRGFPPNLSPALPRR